MAPKTFANESLSRCDQFYQIFVQIGANLAIFQPFEISIFFRNFERPFTPRNQLRSASNLAKMRFRRSPKSSPAPPESCPPLDVSPGTRLAQKPLKTNQKPLILGPPALDCAPDLARILPNTGGSGPDAKTPGTVRMLFGLRP